MNANELPPEDGDGVVLPFDAGERAALLGLNVPPEDDIDFGPSQVDPEDSWLPKNLAELEARPPIRPTLGGLGIVYPGKRHVFSGPPESAKTLAAYAVGLEVIRAGACIAILDFEMGPWDARDRLVDLGATRDELADILYVDPTEPATEERIRHLVAAGPELVIIDAAAGAYDNLGLDDGKRMDVERFSGVYVRLFWKAGIATILVDHVVKNPETRGKFAIGSERKAGGTDVHLGFDIVAPVRRGHTGLYKITTHKDRGGYLQRGRLADFHLTSDPDTHRISYEFREAEHTDAGDEFRPTVIMARVSMFLSEQPEPVSFSHVKERVTGKDRFVAVALERLISEGYASETIGPRSTRNVSHVSLYTDQDPPLPTPAPPLPAGLPSTPAPASIAGRGGNGSEAPENGRPLPTPNEVLENIDDHHDDIPF